MSSAEKLAYAHKLVGVYYSTICLDHHKSKDTYFCIETVIEPNGGIKYRAMHAGYISEIAPYGWGPDRETFEAACDDLIANLKVWIREQLDWAVRAQSDDEWLSDAGIGLEIIRRVEAANFDWL